MRHAEVRGLGLASLTGLVLLLVALGTSRVAAQESSQTDEPPEPGVTVHVVQRGETLFSIAQSYGTTVEAVQAANNLPDATRIEVGERLIIPAGSVYAASLPGTVTIQPDDSLSSLALRLGQSAGPLAVQNHIVNPDLLFAGQTLGLAADLSGAGPIATGQVYAMQSGETFSRLAVARGLSEVALLRANHLLSPAQVYPAMSVLVPGSGPQVNALESPWVDVTIHPLPAEQGRTITLSVETSVPGSMAGHFLSRDLNFVSEGQSHTALIGIHAFTRPGIYPLSLTFAAADGTSASLERGVLVADGGYAIETINVPAGLEGLLDEVLLDSEYTDIAALMSGFTPERYWQGLFLLPTGGDVASAFGTRRDYQGVGAELTERFHSGADFAMPIATPIQAPAAGVVVFTGLLEVRGNTTVINHGWGVYTGYWHQAGIVVNTGDVVQAGQPIGSVGETGLVTGAHLHWELWVSGVQVDPLQWVREEMP